MSEEWGPLVFHCGDDMPRCPCPGMWIKAVGGHGGKYEGLSHAEKLDPHWAWHDEFEPIVAYRIRRPRALLQLIEMVKNLPAPAQPRVDA